MTLVEEHTDSGSGGSAQNAELEQEVADLYSEHAVKLLRYAETLTRDTDVGRDAVQEVFLRYSAERRYGVRVENPRAWLYRVLQKSPDRSTEPGSDEVRGIRRGRGRDA